MPTPPTNPPTAGPRVQRCDPPTDHPIHGYLHIGPGTPPITLHTAAAVDALATLIAEHAAYRDLTQTQAAEADYLNTQIATLHGELQTALERAHTAETWLADLQAAAHTFDDTSVVNPVTGQPYGPGPLWAGTEPMDYPDPRCHCGAAWDWDNGGCTDVAARYERARPVLAAAHEMVARCVDTGYRPTYLLPLIAAVTNHTNPPPAAATPAPLNVIVSEAIPVHSPPPLP